MEGPSVISPDVLARYAADAAREVPASTGSSRADDGVKVARTTIGSPSSSISHSTGARTPESWEPRCRPTSPTTSRAWPTSVRDAVDVIVDEWRSASPA